MKNTYIIILVLIVLVVGGALVFGMGGKTEVPTGEAPISVPTGSDKEEAVFCTMDAKLCPDGSYVGRTGPNCEFSACPEVVDTEESTADVKEFTVSASNFSFSPSTLRVAEGDRVKITFKNTMGFHDFVIDEYGIAAKQTQSPTTEVIEFTANKAGSFEYYCSIGTHRAMGMRGTLVVE
ncbi:MAG: cupredoxin domain-containing protein [Candidatus Paceibacterota bacterium]